MDFGKRRETPMTEATTTNSKVKVTEAHESLQRWLATNPKGPQIDIPVEHVSALVLYFPTWQRSPERSAERKELRIKRAEEEKAERAAKAEAREQARLAKEAEKEAKAKEAEEARAKREAEQEQKRAEREAKLAEQEKQREEREAERERKAQEREEKRLQAEAEREQKAQDREAKRQEREAEKQRKAEEREAAKAAKEAEKAADRGADGDDGSAPAGDTGRGALRESKRLKRRAPQQESVGASASEF